MSGLQKNINVPMEDGPVAALCHALKELGLEGPIGLEEVGQGTSQNSLALIPNAQKPRLIVPAAPARASAEALRRYSADLSVPQRVQRFLAVQGLRILGPRKPITSHQLTLNLGLDQGLLAYLAAIIGQPVTFSMSIGNARANQKPILQLFSRAGQSLGFVKVGTNSFTAELVRQEAINLRLLGEQRFEHLRVPRVLHAGAWQEHQLLVMEALPTGVFAPRRRFERLKTLAERELGEKFGTKNQPVNESSWLTSLRELPPQPHHGTGLWARWWAAIELLTLARGSEYLDFAASHGDWTAWNMADYRGRLHVWDWERFASEIPLGFDSLHFAIHRQFSLSGVNVQSLDMALTALPNLSGTLKACYLADLAGRYLRGQQEQQVPAVQAKTEVLISVLEKILGNNT